MGKEEDQRRHDDLTVRVAGLAYSVTEASLSKDFGECGEIHRLKLSRDADGNPRGRAFIEFTTSEAVEKALLFHEKEYAGRTVYVRKADDDSKGKGKAKGTNSSGRDADRRQEGQASDKHAKEVKE